MPSTRARTESRKMGSAPVSTRKPRPKPRPPIASPATGAALPTSPRTDRDQPSAVRDSMTVQEGSPVVPLPGRARTMRWGYYSVRVLLVLALLALAAGLPGSGPARDKYRYNMGDIARERVVAPYDFRVQKEEGELRRQQEQAAASVPPVFRVDTRISSETLNRFATFQERVLGIVLKTDTQPAERAAQLRTLGVPLSEEAAQALAAPGRARRALREMGGVLNEIFASGVGAEKRNDLLLGYRNVNVREGEVETPRSASLLYDRREALARVDERAKAAFPGDPAGVRLLNEMAGPFVQPNITYDQAETDYRRVHAQGAVPTMVGFVQKDELIVDANQKVEGDALLKLRSLRNLELARRSRSEFLYPPVARMLLMLLFITGFASYPLT